jgi:hypothetical protein
MNLSKFDYKEQLLEQLKSIDIDSIKNEEVELYATSKVIEEQKVYFWIRLYLNEESGNIQVGDDITIEWTPTGEKLETKFVCYGKQGLERDHQDEVTSYNAEDDKRILCLMIDTKMVNFNEDIPFIRTLFKTGYHYEYQLVKRSELLFVNKRNGVVFDYYDCDF